LREQAFGHSLAFVALRWCTENGRFRADFQPPQERVYDDCGQDFSRGSKTQANQGIPDFKETT
jgi:hypothetical protein